MTRGDDIEWTRVYIPEDPDWEEFHLNLGTDHISVWMSEDGIYSCACTRPNGKGMIRKRTSLHAAMTMKQAKEMALNWLTS